MLGLKLIYVSKWGLWKPDPPLPTIHKLLHAVNPKKYVHFLRLDFVYFGDLILVFTRVHYYRQISF